MNYLVLTGDDPSELMLKVNKFSREGWLIVGGLTMAYEPVNGINPAKIIYGQAMIKTNSYPLQEMKR